MTLQNKVTITTRRDGECKIEVISGVHPVDELIVLMVQGLINSGALKT